MNSIKDYFGAFVGTFILVFIGCGAVGVTILYGWLSSLIEVALVWGIGVALAIYISRRISFAHLNPAVSVAMALAGRISFKKCFFYCLRNCENNY